MDRRTFMGGVGMAAGTSMMAAAAVERAEWPKLKPATIYKVYIGRSGATVNQRTGSTVQYLTWGKEEIVKMDNHLDDLAKKLGDVTFTGGETIPPTDVEQIAARGGFRRRATAGVAVGARRRLRDAREAELRRR